MTPTLEYFGEGTKPEHRVCDEDDYFERERERRDGC